MTGNKLKKLFIGFLTISIYLVAFSAAAWSESNNPVVQLKQNNMFVSANQASLTEILEKLAGLTATEIVIFGDIERPISLELSGVGIEKGYKRLLNSMNYSVVYSGDITPDENPHIAKIIIYGDKSNGKTNIHRDPIVAQPSRKPIKIQKQIVRSIESMTRPGTPASLESYVELLDSKDPVDREDAVTGLVLEHREVAMDFLEDILLTDEDTTVRSIAAESIGELEHEKGISALTKSLQDSDDDVRSATVQALATIGGENVLPLLENASSDSNEDIRYEASYAIEEIKDDLEEDV